MNRDSILEDLVYSKDFKGTLLSFEKGVFRNVILGIEVRSWKGQGLHGLSELCHCCRDLINKYKDISASSTLNPGTKTRFLNIFCGVEHNMCNTKVKDITWNLLFNWWKNLKLVQHAEFNIQFAK